MSLLARLPSFFDPPWLNDEGTYFAVAQAMSHGYRLYRDVWENKPPGIYLLYSAVYHLFGPSMVAVRSLAAVSAVVVVALTIAIARRSVGTYCSLAAGMVAGLLLAVPFIEGTTANAETFLVLLTCLAVYAAVCRGRYVTSGACMGIAGLFKIVALADAGALGLWVFRSRNLRSGRYLLGLVSTLLLAGLLADRFGLLPGLFKDGISYGLGYVGRGNGGGFPWPLAMKLVLLMVLSFRLRDAPFPYLWLLYATFGALSSGRVFGHYFVQIIPPFSVSIGLLLGQRERLGHALMMWLPAACLLLAIASSGAGWTIARAGHDTIVARRLQWYTNFAGWATGGMSREAYQSTIDDHVRRNLLVVRQLRSLLPGKLLVWGNVPWVYVLSDRLPATPYTSAFRDPPVPGEGSALRGAVLDGKPSVVVVIDPPLPGLGSAGRALSGSYRRMFRVQEAEIYVRRV